jgi:hypothetical protein
MFQPNLENSRGVGGWRDRQNPTLITGCLTAFFFPYNNLSSIQDIEGSRARTAIAGYCTEQQPRGVTVLKRKV